MKVRLIRDGVLWAIVSAEDGMWLAGLLSEANRALYLSWHLEWEVVA